MLKGRASVATKRSMDEKTWTIKTAMQKPIDSYPSSFTGKESKLARFIEYSIDRSCTKH
jgi:hypothetical protein